MMNFILISCLTWQMHSRSYLPEHDDPNMQPCNPILARAARTQAHNTALCLGLWLWCSKHGCRVRGENGGNGGVGDIGNSAIPRGVLTQLTSPCLWCCTTGDMDNACRDGRAGTCTLYGP